MPFKKQVVHAVEGAQRPQIAPLTGQKLAKRSRVQAVMRSQDKVAPLSRRVIGAQSLAGATSWLVPDSNPDWPTQTHPLTNELRTVMRTRCDVTPGCFLRLYVCYTPCGQTQIETSFGVDYDTGGASASVQIDVTWTDQDGNTETTTQAATLQPSPELYAGSPDDPWTSVRIIAITLIAPEDIDEVDTLAQWTRHVHAEVTMSHIGGCRVIDAIVEEWPYSVAREVDDAADLWTSHMFADVSPVSEGPVVSHPFQRKSETTPDGDPRLGAWHLMDVANAQRLRLGPQLFNWTAWNESSAAVDAVEIPVVSTSSTSFVRVTDGVTTGYDADGPGWSISNYSRAYSENHPHWSTNSGSIPVLVAVYAATEVIGAVGELRLQVSPDSWIEVPVNDRFFGWWFGYGHLRCGVGPGDDTNAQALYRMLSGSGGLRIKALCAYQMGNYPAVWT